MESVWRFICQQCNNDFELVCNDPNAQKCPKCGSRQLIKKIVNRFTVGRGSTGSTDSTKGGTEH
jgi:DNA-directed RNA polymerase subunit RPC12/RpoP